MTPTQIRIRRLWLIVCIAISCSSHLDAQATKEFLVHGGYVKDAKNPRVIVFVHGLYSNPDAWRCDPQHYWPDMIAADQDTAFANTDVYVVAYPTPKWKGKMTISDLDSIIANQLESDGVFARHTEVVIVAHSLGGIVTEELLLTYRDKELFKKVKFIYMLGTPLEGAGLANILKYFTSDPLPKQLTTGDSNLILHDMDQKWIHSGFSDIPRYCAYETQAVDGLQVVNHFSATRGCKDEFSIPENHIRIAKPCDTKSVSYSVLANKLRELNSSTSPSQDHLVVQPASSLDPAEAFLQQFTVTNTGETVYGFHFACSVTYIAREDKVQEPFGKKDTFAFMVPVMAAKDRLTRGEKTTVDCDYLMRQGSLIKAADIELELGYKTAPGGNDEFHWQAFSGRRNAEGKFEWSYGSPSRSPLDLTTKGATQRTAIVFPFGGNNRFLQPNPSAAEFFDLINGWTRRLSVAGNMVILTTMIDGNYSDRP